MEQPGTQTEGLGWRLPLFLIIIISLVILNRYLMSVLNPKPKELPQRPVAAAQEGEEDDLDEPADPADIEESNEGDKQPAESETASASDPPRPDPASDPTKPPAIPPAPAIPPEVVTLGSIDPASSFRMLITLSNQGASIVRTELSSPRYRDLEDRTGYLGHLVVKAIPTGEGCPVQVVGPGTPAALAGLEKGDLITAVDGRKVTGHPALARALKACKPKQTVRLEVIRQNEPITLQAALGRRPLEIIRPEGTDPLSFLLTLKQIDKLTLEDVVKKFKQEALDAQEEAEKAAEEAGKKKEKDDGNKTRDQSLGLEIAGLDLRTGTWEIVRHSQVEAVFRRMVPDQELEILKTYRLAKVPAESQDDETFNGYHLTFDIEIRNTGQRAHKVAYQLDGPTGLPTEGHWYANKISRNWWSAAGLRDVVVAFGNSRTPKMIDCPKIADGKIGTPWQDQPVAFIGVDSQYFSTVLMPRKKEPGEIWLATSQPLRVGPVRKKWKKLTNVSCRLTSLVYDLKPGESVSHSYLVFAGPKKPDLLVKYELKELVYYGLFSWVAKPMLWLLHLFYAWVHNYGLAIIMLTILVRSGMFPLSKKQALSAQKMAALQPEIKKLHAKYKNDFEARNRAQQELFKKHNCNPLSGCWVAFLQLPIFLGLYRSLMVDVELRQAPLLSEGVRWCSNLAAPDMLFEWTFMPLWVTTEPGNSLLSILFLGPYFNLLPIFTVALFILQQKMFMPPPTDEQTAMQQNVMKYMMFFMGIIFFKVASGLCIYFIASSAWGLAERKLLPKRPVPNDNDTSKTDRALLDVSPKRSQGGTGTKKKKPKKKNRGKR